ncbi:unnamed protein product [Effrenium voratum]|uniref:RRM domain-containing protein n=1 Tax=Effrenium voratum TaxID=2562239 RepID=A0AA36MUY4_9DINO|nr:unnamed protein product [Effrenium voratum]
MASDAGFTAEGTFDREGVPPEDNRWKGVRHIFIQNLPARVSQQQFHEFIRLCSAPEPEQLKFPVYANGKSRGYAVASFRDCASAGAFVAATWQQRVPGFQKPEPIACQPCVARSRGLRRRMIGGKASPLFDPGPSSVSHFRNKMPSDYQSGYDDAPTVTSMSSDPPFTYTEAHASDWLDGEVPASLPTPRFLRTRVDL